MSRLPFLLAALLGAAAATAAAPRPNILFILTADLGIADNTLLVFTSDNGPHNESGTGGTYTQDPTFFRSYAGMDGIKRDAWEGGLRVPAIALWPAHITPGATSTPTSQASTRSPSTCLPPPPPAASSACASTPDPLPQPRRHAKGSKPPSNIDNPHSLAMICPLGKPRRIAHAGGPLFPNLSRRDEMVTGPANRPPDSGLAFPVPVLWLAPTRPLNRPRQAPTSGQLMKTRSLATTLAACLASTLAHAAPIPITGTGSYTQDFNTLPSSGTTNPWTDDSTIAAWYAQRSGSGTTIAADNGTATAGNLYSYGSTDATERALGSLGSGNAAAGHFAWGVQFQNTGANPVTINSVAYRGEQWRNSAAAAQAVTFFYQVSTSPITDLTPDPFYATGWTAIASLDFTSPVTGGTAGALDGNAAPNFTAVSATVAITVAPGEYVMLRWSDENHSGTDHGLAIDDVSVGWSEAAPGTLALALVPDTIVESGPSSTSTATVTRSGTPPFADPLTVTISVSDPSVATAPASVVIPAESASANFTVTAVDDSLSDGDQTATVQVSAAGHTDDSKVITVQDDGDVAALVINEILAAPTSSTDANGDGTASTTEDEFVELVNTSGTVLDISGWTLSDSGQPRHTFPEGTVLPVGCAIVVFAGGNPAIFGSALVQTTAAGQLGLNNDGDSVTIRDIYDTLVTSVSFGPPEYGVSINLNPDLTPGAMVLHNTVPGAVGDYSPGFKVDGSEFVALDPLALAITPAAFPESPPGVAATGTVTLPAGAVGPVTVTLSSSDTSEAAVPPTVEIPEGLTSVDFGVTAVDDSEPDGDKLVTITAAVVGFKTATFQVTVQDDGDVAPPPTLVPGDLAFIAYNADGNDDFAFVALAEIPADTTVHFTDNEWNGGTVGAGGTWNELNEGVVTWTSPPTPVAAGTVVVINNASNSSLLAASIGAAAVSGSFNLGASGETLYAYQGTAITPTGFVAAIANHELDSIDGTGLGAAHAVYLPVGADIAAFTGSRSDQPAFANYLGPIGDTTNRWAWQDASGDQSYDAIPPDLPFDTTAFTLGSGGLDYDAWIALYASQLDGYVYFNSDPDLDGYWNGVEWYFFNSNPGVAGTEASAFINATPAAAGSFTFQHRRPVNRPYVIETYQWSTNLVTWTNSGETAGGLRVTLTPNNANPTPDPANPGYEFVTVTVQRTAGTVPKKLFARLDLNYE